MRSNEGERGSRQAHTPTRFFPPLPLFLPPLQNTMAFATTTTRTPVSARPTVRSGLRRVGEWGGCRGARCRRAGEARERLKNKGWGPFSIARACPLSRPRPPSSRAPPPSPIPCATHPKCPVPHLPAKSGAALGWAGGHGRGWPDFAPASLPRRRSVLASAATPSRAFSSPPLFPRHKPRPPAAPPAPASSSSGPRSAPS